MSTGDFYSSRPGQTKAGPLNAIQKPVEFTLNSGRVVKFYRKHIAHEKIELETSVSLEVNARLQNELNTKSLTELAASLIHHQFYPAIGYMTEGHLIDLMDGSRRRAGALIAKVGLDVMYCKTPLTVSEAQDLAEQMQSAEKHSHRDMGAKYLRYKEANTLEQKEVAVAFNVSEAHVSTCITAYSIDFEIIKLFDALDPLVAKDYRELKKFEKLIEADRLTLQDVVSQVSKQARSVEHQRDLSKEQVMTFLGHYCQSSKSRGQKVKFEAIASFNKNKFIRRKTDASGNKVTIEFSRIEKDKMARIEAFIRQVSSEK